MKNNETLPVYSNAELIKKVPKQKVKNVSVRTTIKINSKTKEALAELKNKHSLSPKEILEDILKSVVDILGAMDIPKIFSSEQKDKTLIDLKDSFESKDKEELKVFVIGKNELQKINELSKKTEIPRDNIFRLAILFYRWVLTGRIEERKENYKKCLEIISDLESTIEIHKDQLINEFDDDGDAIIGRVGMISVCVMNLKLAVENYINNGIEVDPSDLSQQ